MSILIKGIEKPISCDDCIVPLSKCDFLQRRADECPIVEIPTPHGRLIDGGELYKDFENHCGGECDCCVHETENYNCGLIANALTILESEE